MKRIKVGEKEVKRQREKGKNPRSFRSLSWP